MSLSGALSSSPAAHPAAPVTLVARLAEALRDEGVTYCQWKGRTRRERWTAGLGDVDLLVEPAHWARFTRILGGLGFRAAAAPGDAPGVHHFYGLEDWSGRLIHVHAYTRLVIGSPWWSEYRLPLEQALLRSALAGPVFDAPAPEPELIVHVLRSVVRLTPGHFVRLETPRFLADACAHAERLEEEAAPEGVRALLRRHLPAIDPGLFARCRAVLDPGTRQRERLATRLLVGRRLAPDLVRPPLASAALWGRHRLVPRRRSLANGGVVIALVGGDGAGKSTCAAALLAWLRPDLATCHLHLGRPSRSVVTLLLGALLKAGRVLRLPRPAVAHLELLRLAGTAGDRYRLYRRARRFAARGGIAVCERYPVREQWALSGPSGAQGLAGAATSPLAQRVRRWERGCYERMAPPDVTLVLLLDGDTAAQRKPGEPADYVRRRAALTGAADWRAAGAVVLDASEPLPEVLAALRRAVWSAL